MAYCRSKHLPQIILAQTFIGLIMFSLGLTIVFFAQGYRLNMKNMRIIKTGILSLSADRKEADIYVNGRLESSKLPFHKNLYSGYYDVRIEKTGYISWQASAKIEEELVMEYKNIVLFYQNPKTSDTTDTKKIEQLNNPIDLLAIKHNNGLMTDDYEIWVDDKLVARFSEPISRAIWYSDRKHIVFQQGDEIRIIETTGNNDTVLVKLTGPDPTNFVLLGRGSEILYLDGGNYKTAVIK